MDASRKTWYFADIMQQSHPPKPAAQAIPVWHLYGEETAFPDVLHIETITDRAAGLDWQIAAHRHLHLHQFFLIEAGDVRITLDGESLQQKPPFLLNVPVGVVHGFTFAANTKGWVLTLPLQSLPDLSVSLALREPALERARLLPVTPAIVELFCNIHQEHGSSRPARSVMLLALAAQLACLALRELDQRAIGDKGRLDPRFHRFQNLLNLHLRDQWRLPDYAREIGISARHLSRICQSVSGQPAAEIIDAAVIHEACRLLVYTRASVASVGYSLGFEDPSYFSRAFRRRMGLSPVAYRAGFERG